MPDLQGKGRHADTYRPHRSEFPPGYSSAGCFPAEPASASPDTYTNQERSLGSRLAVPPISVPWSGKNNRNDKQKFAAVAVFLCSCGAIPLRARKPLSYCRT
jgi:hypothetical protein